MGVSYMLNSDKTFNAKMEAVADELLELSKEFGGLFRVNLEAIPEGEWAARFELLETENQLLERYERGLTKRLEKFRASIERERVHLSFEYLDRLRKEHGAESLKFRIRRIEETAVRKTVNERFRKMREERILQGIRGQKLTWDQPLRKEAKFGLHIDERILEIPLGLEVSQLDRPGKVLDAGSALNLPFLRDFIGTPEAHLVHLTQSSDSEYYKTDGPKISYVYADLRDLDYKNGAFDRIVCLSTLEHVGMDNERYGGATETAPKTAMLAFREMLRVLAPGGSLVITVPYGEAKGFGWYRTFGQDDIREMLRVAKKYDVVSRYFYNTKGYWTEKGKRPPVKKLNSADDVSGLCALLIRKPG